MKLIAEPEFNYSLGDSIHHDQAIPSLPFEALVNFHKQEGAEEMTYITIVFTIVLGILAFISSASNVRKWSRVILAVTFTFTLLFFTSAVLGSLKIHNALHLEIKNHVIQNPHSFINGVDSPLYKELSNLHENNATRAAIGFVCIWLVTVLAILFVGNGSLRLKQVRKDGDV